MPSDPHRVDDAQPGEGAGDGASELLNRWQEHLAGQPDRAPQLPRHAAASEGLPPTPSTPLPAEHLADHNIAGREVVAAFAPDAADVARPSPVEEPAARFVPGRRTRPEPLVASTSTDVVFPPRRLARALVGLLVLALLGATIAMGLVANDDRTVLTVGATITLAVLTLAVWGARAGAPPARVSIRSGQLEVVRGRFRDVVDVRSQFTRCQTVGRPGHPGWRVMFARVGQQPLVIDSSMVDAAAFTEALAAQQAVKRK